MKTLVDFQNLHFDKTILVCGCGESLKDLIQSEKFTTIGVNDVGRLFQPNYLVVVNPRSQFAGERFRYVETSKAEYLFTQLDLGVKHPNVVKFKLGSFGGTDFANGNVLHYTNNSPYIALHLAILMGARRIGLIGVDFTENHFFAKTGKHPLAAQFEAIDAQYCRLAEAAKTLGVEIYNLSRQSRLTAFPKMSPEDFAARTTPREESDKLAEVQVDKESSPKVFGVNYRFLACGDVFSTGLRNAARQLSVRYEDAWWDDPRLPAKIRRFDPDLIFVVHGRRFVQKWGKKFNDYRSAVWLVDEPYEVDDTARWSEAFETVFVNDPNTISRHRNAHYLPVCFDAQAHSRGASKRIYKVGFIGGFNENRDRCLHEAAQAGLLSYVVGGPWKSPLLRRLCLAKNVPPEKTTELYRQTEIVVNVFREVHHFNRRNVPAWSMNPRIYEALACGALVVSESRPEIAEVFPELPVFDNRSELLGRLGQLADDEARREALLVKNRARLAGHSYRDRLARVLQICLPDRVKTASALPEKEVTTDMKPLTIAAKVVAPSSENAIRTKCEKTLPDWLNYGDAAAVDKSGAVVFSKNFSDAPGSETGLVSARSYNDVELSFDVWLDAGTWFIAKIHQLDQTDQTTNSYHLVSEPKASYLAKHQHILAPLRIERGVWRTVTFRWTDQLIEVEIDRKKAARIPDNQLQSGYCFIGVKGGRAKIKNVRLRDLSTVQAAVLPANGRKLETPNDRRARGGKRPKPGAEVWQFTETPRRNLIYHIYPVKGSVWKWNLDQLKSRIDLFNGRRIVGIVYDERTEPPEKVEEYLDGHGVEFIAARNKACGETITFPQMMKKVASEDENEVTFYAHAKGVKYEPNAPAPVRRWTEVLYRVALDDWLAVRGQLERFAMTGAFKMLGRFRAHRHLADWHYSGTFFWMRNAHVFSRGFAGVPQFYGGVETFPGMMFGKNETGCLFLDNLRELPYHEQFWRKNANAAFNKWELAASAPMPPPDLVHPLPFKGLTEPRMEQKAGEFEWWIERLLKIKASRVLTIGSTYGGVEWHLAREFFERKCEIEITTIEKSPSPVLAQVFDDARNRFGQSLKLVNEDSNADSVREKLAARYDAVFIDGDHGYRSCRGDFELAKSLNPKIVGLHDIVDSDWHAHARCCVSRLWSELRQQYPTDEKSAGEWGGIGIVNLEKA